MSTPTDDFAATPPPWHVFPELSPWEPTNQGVVDAYITLEWFPFWQALDADTRAAYLDHWHATPEWRAAIAERYDGDDEALAEEARAHRRAEQARKKPGLFGWLRG